MTRVETEGIGDTEWPAAWPEGLDAVGARSTGGLPEPPNAPWSVRVVWRALRAAGTGTSQELRRRAGVPERTLRHAVRWLERRGLCERVAHLGDARRNRIRLLAGGGA